MNCWRNVVSSWQPIRMTQKTRTNRKALGALTVHPANPSDEPPVSPNLAPRTNAEACRDANSFGITSCFEIFGADDAARPV